MSQTSENINLKKVKDGDREAFQIIFLKYYQPLFIFALKFVGEEQAKDIVQDCFCDLWKNRNRIEITTSLSGYLFTVIKNRCFKHLKKEQKKLKRQNNFRLKLKEEEFQFFLNSEKSILEFGIKDRMEKVVKCLPDKCREIFNESRINGYSNKEIAEKQHITVKAVEKQITKALKLFREEFKDIIILLVIIIRSIF